jgi:general secretion pathway protein E/type IV pilus assembly protein PilB
VRAGFTFAAGLRAILRQDPDVILVGEMRDSETAGIALQAALTGHLVLSTVHTSDAVETIVRLVDLGVEPWIIASSLSGIIAQRLVRTVCRHCVQVKPLENDFWENDEVLMMAGTQTLHARGCRACNNSGYRGRTGIFEVFEVDDAVRDLIKAKAPVTEFRALMRTRKNTTLRGAGMVKVKEGLTTVAEVGRVT